MATFNNPVLYCDNETEAINRGMRTKIRYKWFHNPSAKSGVSTVYTNNLEDAERLIEHWDGRGEVWGYVLLETSPIGSYYTTKAQSSDKCPSCRRPY